MSAASAGAVIALIRDLLDKQEAGYEIWFGYNGADRLLSFSVGKYMVRCIPARPGEIGLARDRMRQAFGGNGYDAKRTAL